MKSRANKGIKAMFKQELEEYKKRVTDSAEEAFLELLELHSDGLETEGEQAVEEVAREYFVEGVARGMDAMISLVNKLIASGDIKIMREVVIQRDKEKLN